MPTTTPLTDAINALTTYSNTVTGASDTTLSDAVATLAAGYGGGGGPLTKLYDNTLAQDSRTVTINIEQSWLNYDMLLCFVNGEFTAADWLYWNLDATTLNNNQYSAKQTRLSNPVWLLKSITRSPECVTVAFLEKTGYISTVYVNTAHAWGSMGYLWLSGYSNDLKAGTTITLYGGNYADF